MSLVHVATKVRWRGGLYAPRFLPRLWLRLTSLSLSFVPSPLSRSRGGLFSGAGIHMMADVPLSSRSLPSPCHISTMSHTRVLGCFSHLSLHIPSFAPKLSASLL